MGFRLDCEPENRSAIIKSAGEPLFGTVLPWQPVLVPFTP